MATIQATKMRKGTLVRIGNDLFRVLELQHVTPGNLGGFGLGFRRLATEFQDEALDQQNTITLSHGFQLHKDVSTAVAFGYALNLY